MREYVLVTEKQGWNHVLTLEGGASRVEFGLCATQSRGCNLRVSLGSAPDVLQADDVVAYLCVSPCVPKDGADLPRHDGPLRVDLFQPGHESVTGGHLLVT